MNDVVLFSGFRNKEYATFIVESGGKVVETMSKKVTMLIIKSGDSDSAKVKKARDMGVTIITGDEFADKYNM